MFRHKTNPSLLELLLGNCHPRGHWWQRKPKVYTHTFTVIGTPEADPKVIDFMNRQSFHLLRNGTLLAVWRTFPYEEGVPQK